MQPHRKRFDLPPLDRLEVFEAAARNLSFTRAASELSRTQSAVSRSIALLEDRIGFALFERRHRSLLLTERGQALYAAARDALERLHDAMAKLRAPQAGRTVTVTANLSFASLWLIPRLRGFTREHPGVDVRIAASNDLLDLDRAGIDLAVRYSTGERAPGGSKLFDEAVFPVCSPALARDPARPLATPADLARHVLLHLEDARLAPWLDWAQWLESAGVPDLRPAGALRFSHYDQLVQAAVTGQGVALGRTPLMRELMRAGRLVAPFKRAIATPRSYYLMRGRRSLGNAEVDAFAQWLRVEAARTGAADYARAGTRLSRRSSRARRGT
ncbi:MAG: transcriptional regulator GcvA [Burkholderiales bacterium]|nr:transcriptional regulator GcvA [Burkholderiales bacterium]